MPASRRLASAAGRHTWPPVISTRVNVRTPDTRRHREQTGHGTLLRWTSVEGSNG
jgi:hypothetical protein